MPCNCGNKTALSSRAVKNPGGKVRYVIEGGALASAVNVDDLKQARQLAKDNGARLRVERV